LSEPTAKPSNAHKIGIPDVLMFLLELAMWASFFWIGWKIGDGITRWVFALVFGVAAILLWGLFRTPGMPPAEKDGVLPTPGPVRLVIEIGVFLLAGLGLWWTGYRWAAETLWTFAALIYLLSLSRIRWLLAH
jgi:hypothetical protein